MHVSKLCVNLGITWTILFSTITAGNSQIVNNPSFDGPTGASSVPSGWTICSGTPDVQIINGTGIGIYGINTPPSDGTSYMGMVSSSSSWIEAMGQLLPTPLQAGVSYTGSVDLYTSALHPNWVDRGEIQFWGGNSSCQYQELLWSSGMINNFNSWQNYSISFTPSSNYSYLTIKI